MAAMMNRTRYFVCLCILALLACLGYLTLLERGTFAGDYLAPIFRYLLLTYDVAAGWLWLRASISPAGALSTWSARLAGVFAFPDSVLFNMRAASTAKLWIWAIPCLFPLALSGYLACRANRTVRLLAQSALLTFLGYFFVRPDQGHGWGFRYFHPAWGAIPINSDRTGQDQHFVLAFDQVAPNRKSLSATWYLTEFQGGQTFPAIGAFSRLDRYRVLG